MGPIHSPLSPSQILSFLPSTCVGQFAFSVPLILFLTLMAPKPRESHGVVERGVIRPRARSLLDYHFPVWPWAGCQTSLALSIAGQTREDTPEPKPPGLGRLVCFPRHDHPTMQGSEKVLCPTPNGVGYPLNFQGSPHHESELEIGTAAGY